MQKPIQFLQDIAHQNDPDAYWFFMFHGFGADATDLRGLVEYLQPEHKKINWLFPNGIITVPIGPMNSGRAWWPLTLNQLPSDWTLYSPPEMDQLKLATYKMILSFKIPWNKIILGGFSQGAMLATELYLGAPEIPAGLVSFSGSLIRKSAWQGALEKRAPQKIFFSHGEQDQVLPSGGTHKLINLFKQFGNTCEFASFRGGHEIPLDVLNKAQRYLDALP